MIHQRLFSYSNHPTNLPDEEEPLVRLLESPYQLEPPLPQIQTVINNLSPKTSPGYDLITGKILQELPPVGIKYITQLFNASLLLGYFPNQWKVAQIILLLKPDKPPNAPTSYLPISLLPTLSKVFEKLLHHRLLPIVENQQSYLTTNLAFVNIIQQFNKHTNSEQDSQSNRN
jgi:hypothetical protein